MTSNDLKWPQWPQKLQWSHFIKWPQQPQMTSSTSNDPYNLKWPLQPQMTSTNSNDLNKLKFPQQPQMTSINCSSLRSQKPGKMRHFGLLCDDVTFHSQEGIRVKIVMGHHLGVFTVTCNRKSFCFAYNGRASSELRHSLSRFSSKLQGTKEII